MRVKELKAILEKENINPVDYDILGIGHVKGYDGYILRKDVSGKYQLFYEERGQKEILSEYQTEEEACLRFLQQMAKDDQKLKRYI